MTKGKLIWIGACKIISEKETKKNRGGTMSKVNKPVRKTKKDRERQHRRLDVGENSRDDVKEKEEEQKDS
jgi:hypothetical protein